MAVNEQDITDKWALYNGDCVQVMKDLPAESVGLTVYSPPFGGLYQYSSSDEDLSNSKDYTEFFRHYDFVVSEITRITKPGRMTAVHCMDVPRGGDRGMIDFPGDIIRQHERLGWDYWARYDIWKEPLRVAIRTRSKGLTHRQLVKDSSLSGNAGADYVLVFRKKGTNPEPIVHPVGLTQYRGEREIPAMFVTPDGRTHSRDEFLTWEDPQTNKRAHWIWQQYASSFWDDIRIGRVLPYKAARDSAEEKHIHPLQLDVIERCILLWSNPGDVVLTPFAGVGSEVYGAIINGRRGIGIELKESFYRQMVRNIHDWEALSKEGPAKLFDVDDDVSDSFPE